MSDDTKDRKIPSIDPQNFAEDTSKDPIGNSRTGQESEGGSTTESAEQAYQEASENKNAATEKSSGPAASPQKIKTLPQIGSVEDTSTDAISEDTLGGMETKKPT